MRGPSSAAPRAGWTSVVCVIAFWNPADAVNGVLRTLVGSEFELDHVLSLNQRGSNTSVNLVVACPECNRRKAKKHPARFAAEIYSETGTKTTLVSRILQAGDVLARRQLGIFDAEEAPAGQRVEIEDDLHQVPPYNWTD